MESLHNTAYLDYCYQAAREILAASAAGLSDDAIKQLIDKAANSQGLAAAHIHEALDNLNRETQNG